MNEPNNAKSNFVNLDSIPNEQRTICDVRVGVRDAMDQRAARRREEHQRARRRSAPLRVRPSAPRSFRNMNDPVS
jgi:hypothetical protein